VGGGVTGFGEIFDWIIDPVLLITKLSGVAKFDTSVLYTEVLTPHSKFVFKGGGEGVGAGGGGVGFGGVGEGGVVGGGDTGFGGVTVGGGVGTGGGVVGKMLD
jgi:hypothetical protein